MDSAGNPIANSLVNANDRNGKPMAMAIPQCLTDAHGSCTCPHLELARYQVTASKVADGFPDTSWSLYGHRLKPIIVLRTPAQPSGGVTVVLGPRAGLLFLRIANADTGAAVFNPSIVLSLASNSHSWLSQGLGKESGVLVPADEDILLEIDAEGYKNWHLPTRPGEVAPQPILLTSGQREELAIQMQPQ